MSFKYFDLHIHPVFKTLFKNEGDQVSGWIPIAVPDRLLGNCFDSQSCLKMVFSDVCANLLCIGKHAPERGMVFNLATRLASGMPGYAKFMDPSRLKKLHLSLIDYQQVHSEEMKNLFEAPPYAQKGYRIQPLKKMSEYDLNNCNTAYVVFHVEGAHMFYERGNQAVNIDNMIRIFNEYRQEHLLLYVTVAHLTPNVFANHADGNKIFPNEETWPSGRGIKPFGERLIAEMYNQNVLVDIKHMSWVSRKDLYDIRQKNGWEHIPLVASHAALTGFKADERMDYIYKIKGIKRAPKVYKVRYKKKDGLLGNTKFNPNSINLYDDEVVTILKSKGLLGINFDKRILGASEKLTGGIKVKETEFISIEEASEWFGPTSETDFSPIFDDYTRFGRRGEFIPDEEDWEESEEEFQELFPKQPSTGKAAKRKISRNRAQLHLKYFCNQLLKIKMIADENAAVLQGINIWDHICMGADFDGLISTIHCCSDITKVENFAGQVNDNLKNFADQAGIQLGMPVPDIVEKIFFKNGHDFLIKHFGI